VLAAAGVRRLGWPIGLPRYWMNRSCCPLWARAPCASRPARDKDPRIASVVAALDDLPTRKVVMGERAFLNRLEGGCQVPIAGHGHIDGENGFILTGLVCDVDGSHQIKASTLRPRHPERSRSGRELADMLLAEGADRKLERLNATCTLTPHRHGVPRGRRSRRSRTDHRQGCRLYRQRRRGGLRLSGVPCPAGPRQPDRRK
jgi:hydroxymethylbilane synthase